MKVVWSTLGLVVVGVLALLLWNAASGEPRQEVLREGVVVDGGASSPSPSGTVETPGEETSGAAQNASGESSSQADREDDSQATQPPVTESPVA
ncbi:hypothetical protein, partial [Kocuria subflava]